jgi:biopolymer transport protein ExbB
LEEEFEMSLISLLIKGGILMIPITVCSIFSFGIIIERLIRYQKAKGNVKKLKEKLEPLIIGNKVSEARLLCEESSGYIAKIFLVALQELQKESNMQKPVEDEINATQRVIDEDLQVSIVPALEKHLNTLDTLARGTPLLGLLGTVIGMIKVFFSIGIGQSMADPAVLAKGIGLALITTAAGLVVAIPSFFMHRYFIGEVDYLLEEAQKAKGWLLGQLAKRRLISPLNAHE